MLLAEGTEGLAECGTGKVQQQPAQGIESDGDGTRICPPAHGLQGSQGTPRKGLPRLRPVERVSEDVMVNQPAKGNQNTT